MKLLADCYLYAFVDTAYLHGRAPAEIARQLCDGGADLIQLRAKGVSKQDVTAMAEAVLPIARAAGIGLVINDHLDVAQKVGAEFCHLGQEDFFGAGLMQVSSLQPSGAHRVGIGLSSHAALEAEKAVAAGADYLGVGPVFATNTKPNAKPVTLDYVRWAAENITVPWFAIGGINLTNLDSVLAAGATRVCAVSAILESPDICRACAEFKKKLEKAV